MDNRKLSSQDTQASQPQQQPTGCCIWPSCSDSLVLISFPRDLLDPFRIAIQNSWIKGIQLEGYHKSDKNSYVIQLRGKPWHRDQVHRCQLIIGIMQFMLLRGWGLELSMVPTEFSTRKGVSDHDSWFFRKQSPEMHVFMCGISYEITGLFNISKRVRVIDGSAEVTEVVHSTIKNHWYGKYQASKTVALDSNVQEFNLRLPGFYTNHAAEFLMHLLVALRSSGWILYASVGIGTFQYNNKDRVHTWILKKVKS